jgi:hypothetical protein
VREKFISHSRAGRERTAVIVNEREKERESNIRAMAHSAQRHNGAGALGRYDVTSNRLIQKTNEIYLSQHQKCANKIPNRKKYIIQLLL